jgi:hypothetical protein
VMEMAHFKLSLVSSGIARPTTSAGRFTEGRDSTADLSNLTMLDPNQVTVPACSIHQL